MTASRHNRLIFRDVLGSDIAAVTGELADLRVRVFRDWPYLYDGDAAYERQYLARYAKQGSIVVAAFDGATMVGAATGMPLVAHADHFAAAFEGSGIDMNDVFYFAESVLLSEYRGQGAGHVFFDRREAYAAHLGYRQAAFCAVSRPEDHPERPVGHRPLDGFWRKRGYAPLPGVIAHFSWRDLGDHEESEKPLQFWARTLP